jgi:small subunit ribosomal protein S24e
MPMKIEILSERENKPLARREIEFRVDHAGAKTPSRADVRDKLVAQFDADSSTVVVRIMKTAFGAGITHGKARIYSDPEMMKRAETDHIVERHQKKKAEAGGASEPEPEEESEPEGEDE